MHTVTLNRTVEEKPMVDQRKIIVYIATSADGYIARPDGSVDWLNRPRTAGDYGMGDFYKSIDAVIWGRKTWDQAFAGKKSGGGSKKIKSYVFTHNPPANVKGVEFVSGDISEFARKLKATPGKDIWMMGGGGVIASFLDAGELDEFIIHVIPVFIGEGIPLIAPRRLNVDLSLVGTHAYSDGVVRMHYQCDGATAAKPRGRRKKS
jgi:dihydrofolate reductase